MSDELLDRIVESPPRLDAQAEAEALMVQGSGFFLELSPDWIVKRASENVHRFLGQSHVTMIDEPLGRFVQAQPLHDLRNLFSRLSGTVGIARAYDVRLTVDSDRFDLAFQLSNGRVLLEALPAADSFGETFGSVGGLAEGLSSLVGGALLDAAARRMRALTGFDAVIVEAHGACAQSSRGSFNFDGLPDELPPIVTNVAAEPVPVFPRQSASAAALLRSPARADGETLRSRGIRAAFLIPLRTEGNPFGAFRCYSTTSRVPTMELHAAAELFAQLFAMRLEIERLKGR